MSNGTTLVPSISETTLGCLLPALSPLQIQKVSKVKQVTWKHLSLNDTSYLLRATAVEPE